VSQLQPALLDLRSLVHPDYRPEQTIQERFEEFHRLNPHVYETLKAMCYDLKSLGIRRWSINGMFEVLRWQHAIHTQGDPDFRLNNNHRSRYARMLVQEPGLAGFFETRELKS
jgi:hypothetical protein